MSARILVVDDEPDLEALVLQKFRQQIRHGTVDFLFAHDGVEALATLRANGGIDLVVTDINMPRMDGLALLQKLQENDEGILTIIVSAYGDMGVDMAGQGRLMVIDKVSIINPLPASYEQQIRQIEGVTDITHANWFGGYYQDVRNQFATFATDPESWLRVYPKEFEVPEDQKKAWIADRTGAIVGADTAKKYGWKVGQRVPIQGTIYQRPDRGPWEFTIDGIYDSKIKGADKTNLLFNYQFLRETIPAQSGFRDRYNWYVFTVGDPDRAPEIAAKIDAMFANSPSETKTNTEKAFVSEWSKQVGDIGKIMHSRSTQSARGMEHQELNIEDIRFRQERRTPNCDVTIRNAEC